ncbi:LacI family transcriptional regulator [Cryptosporangium phraense]|uniref:LacI family transcriptional regulator n=1 Tax=Cryptosporangium phraense TaxID=2593070 RepID=A0A545AVM3_9ACTN|nr:LacI family transcriptional regulator [Cryptosporangium phraense]
MSEVWTAAALPLEARRRFRSVLTWARGVRRRPVWSSFAPSPWATVGERKAGDSVARVTLQTIADRVGVSRMTVSNAFSRPNQLSPALREKILAAASDLGYVGPDPAARALARGASGAVGFLLTESIGFAFNDQVSTQLLGAIADELSPTGLALTLLTSSGPGDLIPARDVAMDGALVYSCDPESPAVSYLLQRKLPIVLIDQDPVDDIPGVNVADREGARTAAQHLIDLGHRRIGLAMSGLRGPQGLLEDPREDVGGYASRERLRGWLDALDAAGIVPVATRQRNDSVEETAAAARLLLDRDDRPTAVLCFSDVIALRLIQSARTMGIRVPKDLSVVGFDDHPLAGTFRPALTTVRQDVHAKGRAAAEALTAALRGAEVPEPHVVLPAELVIRDSTAPPPPA